MWPAVHMEAAASCSPLQAWTSVSLSGILCKDCILLCLMYLLVSLAPAPAQRSHRDAQGGLQWRTSTLCLPKEAGRKK
jgi:hypothetical protein